MIVTGEIRKVRKIIDNAKKNNKLVGFVPTMGALHVGHLSLVKKAKKDTDFVVVSIFVNPTQFGPKEDYRKYPRTFKADRELLEKEKVDLIFYPSVSVMYPLGFSTYVEEIYLSHVLCGVSRHKHFKGVCTVITKLFNIIQPDIAYFGHKDYQQVKVIERVAQDLNFSIKIKIVPTMRERDGLAMSSRNIYLDNKERKISVSLYSALSLARKLITRGERNPNKVIKRMKQLVISKNKARIDYMKITEVNTLRDLKKIEGKVLIALAVYVGNTRLIDNLVLNVKK